jgi:hypothetical protein
MMINQKNMAPVFLMIIFALFVVAGMSTNSISAETAAVKDAKEVKEEKATRPDMNPKLENQAQAIQTGFQQNKAKNPYEKADIAIKIIPAADKTFGYDILVNDRPFIHQPHIPGLSGKKGFATKEKAQKTAEFVVKKIRNNNVPPTVTKDDLNKMGVL